MTASASPRNWLSGLVLVGILVVGASVVLVLRARAADLEALRAEVSALRQVTPEKQTLRELRTVVHERVVASAANATNAGASEPADSQAKGSSGDQPEPTDEERQYRTDMIVAAQEKTLEDSYNRESADPEWSSGATTQLRTAYSGEGFEDLHVKSDCRATLCRVSFSYEKPGAEQQWRLFRDRMPWPGATNANVNFETRQGTFYLAREGFELPRIDPATLTF